MISIFYNKGTKKNGFGSSRRFKMSAILFCCASSWTIGANAFGVEHPRLKHDREETTFTALKAEDSKDEASGEEYVAPMGEAKDRSEANLVDQKTFIQSIETLQREVAKANGQEFKAPENPPVYAIGRFEVPLRIDSAPGLDLTDTYVPTVVGEAEADSQDLFQPGLVLVTSVTGNAANAGLQALDTIVGVSCKGTDPPFIANVNSQSLETTAIALQTAMQHALQNNITEIDLEMNRLMSGYY